MSVILVFGTVLVSLLYLLHKPSSQSRTEIFRGIFLTVEKAGTSRDGSGQIMIVEVHWDTPGVRIANRPFDYKVDSDDLSIPHYNLEFADFALYRTGASILMNTTLFEPEKMLHSLPGRPVRSLDTIVVDGQISHVHAHSYLLYWDQSMNARGQLSKPPDQKSLEEAVTGIGMQGVQIQDGIVKWESMGGEENIRARTFIGIDPIERILYLMAFENASDLLMINRALKEGVVHGGQLDSGDSTNLLIGHGVKGIRAHTGIRNFRPLGPYMVVHADPL